MRLRDLTEKARSAYAELVADVEKELEDELLSDTDDEEDCAASHSRSQSVQSRACSEPEPSSDWLALDDVTRGYSSECETGWADDDSEDETMERNDVAVTLQQHSCSQSLDSSPVAVWLTDAAFSTGVLSQELIDSGPVSGSQPVS